MNLTGFSGDAWRTESEPTRSVASFKARIRCEIGLRGSQPALQNKPDHKRGLCFGPSVLNGTCSNFHNQGQRINVLSSHLPERVSNFSSDECKQLDQKKAAQETFAGMIYSRGHPIFEPNSDLATTSNRLNKLPDLDCSGRC